MKGLIVFLSIVLFFVLLSFLKIGVNIKYGKEFYLYLKVLFLKIKIVPGKEKKLDPRDYTREKTKKLEEAAKAKKTKGEEKKKAKKEKKAADKADKKLHPPKKVPIGQKINDTVSMVKVILEVVKLLFSKLFGYIKTDVNSLKVAIGAGDDPSKTAPIYGAAMGAVTALLEFLDNHSRLRIKNKDAVSVLPDFPGHGFEADVDIVISFRVWQIFGIIFPPVIKAAKFFVPKLMKDNKDKKQWQSELEKIKSDAAAAEQDPAKSENGAPRSNNENNLNININ